MLGDPDDIVDALDGLAEDEAFELLRSWQPTIDWTRVPAAAVPLRDGGRVRLDKRRRSASIERPGGGVTVVDLGRRDRMRDRAAIVTADLTRVAGPDLAVLLTPAWSTERGELAVRDPFDRRSKRAATSVLVGSHPTSRYLGPDGRPQLLSVGSLDGVSGFGTFLMDGGTSYAHVRTSSGLAAFSDAGRTSFMATVNGQHADQARFEGFAPVVTRAGPIGVVVDCGAPGDYLALASYDARTGGTVGIVVDLRRPPVRDGAIVDPG